jgi:hypothetical protein
MNEETTTKILWTAVVGGLSAMYGFFLKHLYNHVNKDEIEKLKANVQYKDNCAEIVKRIDGNHQEVCHKLDRLLDILDKKQ